MIKLTLRTLPLTTNSLYAHTGTRRFMTKRGKENKEAMAWEARSQYRGRPLDGPICLKMAVWHADRRRHDLDNLCKALLDSLTGILWLDDNQIQTLILSKFYDKVRPRLEIEIYENGEVKGVEAAFGV